MSLLAPHATDRQRTHECGGTILSGPDHDYCDKCRAFAYDDEDIPDGTDIEANRAAWDAGEDQSPSAEAN